MDEKLYECRRCGRLWHKRHSLTNRGYCKTGCGLLTMVEACAQQQDHAGPHYEAWFRAMDRYVERSKADVPGAGGAWSPGTE